MFLNIHCLNNITRASLANRSWPRGAGRHEVIVPTRLLSGTPMMLIKSEGGRRRLLSESKWLNGCQSWLNG